MDLRLKLAPNARSVRVARRAVDSLPPGLPIDDLKMLVTELVSSAVMHSAGTCAIELGLEVVGEHLVRGEIRAVGPELVERGSSPSWAQMLIDSVACRFEATTDDSGMVMFEVDARRQLARTGPV